MSTPKQAVDIKSLNDFFNRTGKKTISDFNYTRILRIIDRFTAENPVDGRTARGRLETYFDNFEQAETWCKKALELSDYQSTSALQFLLDSYFKSAKVKKINDILDSVISSHPKLLNTNILTILIHCVKSFLDLEAILSINKILKDSRQTHNIEIIEKIIYGINSDCEKLKKIGISIEVYHQIIELVYVTFFTRYNGAIRLIHTVRRSSLQDSTSICGSIGCRTCDLSITSPYA